MHGKRGVGGALRASRCFSGASLSSVGSTVIPWLSALIAVLVIWGLGTIVASLAARLPPRWAEAAAWATLALAVSGFLVWSYLQVVTALATRPTRSLSTSTPLNCSPTG